MNFTLDKKKCIYIVIWLLIGLLSFTVLGKYASAPESHQATIASLDEKKATVLELTAATTATSALITLLPGDIGTPIAEKVADLSGYLLIVLCAVFLEKYLVTITGYAAFKIFIPAACVLYAANMMVRNRSVDKLARSSGKCEGIRSYRDHLSVPDRCDTGGRKEYAGNAGKQQRRAAGDGTGAAEHRSEYSAAGNRNLRHL